MKKKTVSRTRFSWKRWNKWVNLYSKHKVRALPPLEGVEDIKRVQACTHTHLHAHTHMHTRTHARTHARTHTHREDHRDFNLKVMSPFSVGCPCKISGFYIGIQVFVQAVLLTSVSDQRSSFRKLQDSGGVSRCCKPYNGFMTEHWPLKKFHLFTSEWHINSLK